MAPTYHVELAKSGRGQCKPCGKQIAKGEPKFGSGNDGDSIVWWRCIPCVTARQLSSLEKMIGSIEAADGWNAIPSDIQAYIKDAFLNRKAMGDVRKKRIRPTPASSGGLSVPAETVESELEDKTASLKKQPSVHEAKPVNDSLAKEAKAHDEAALGANPVPQADTARQESSQADKPVSPTSPQAKLSGKPTHANQTGKYCIHPVRQLET
ncbi:unnamed protein product (mitochondrion) [Plasmodiophora brassicae]|uniref:PARP-type domain-containing protein n=1 Tax=Plasmodiophora brassicae TaxID=37360 RepID=A0A3P3YFL8_PLABS|nr:unnamed protein product [Plasmodiophora brassicae]